MPKLDPTAFVQKLRFLAKRELAEDNFPDCSVYEIVGSNVDDAFAAGAQAGETLLARQLLEDLGE